ncbi:hypothetical protein [Streptomyces peucetius]|uniref:Uncharacterized protein n=1 Tax=Streptomyces peucetius TaxID=1950 RepID=A0ABY6I6Y3_STRPE|nr:hypothetical protein [Streptomyces peucetius]UYQ62763.1 hypothetical protein OGH68_15585 [Streptomyces peucetius]
MDNFGGQLNKISATAIHPERPPRLPLATLATRQNGIFWTNVRFDSARPA